MSGELFERYLDLAPLRVRRRGLVSCPFHQDSTPSLSVDLDAEVFKCFGCGEQGGRNRFAELVGEAVPAGARRRSLESPLQEARREILRTARRQPWAQPDVQLHYRLADRVRLSRRAVVDLRRLAETIEDEGQRWNILGRAARIETLGHLLEHHLDEIAALGRIG
jgi:hypothetical protein